VSPSSFVFCSLYFVILNSYFILSSPSAIFRASYRNPDEANTFGERLSPVMDELNLPLAA